MTKNRLYLLLGTGTIAGYGWITWSFTKVKEHNDFSVCTFKSITGQPCPSCGSTRAVMELAEGNFISAATLNPLGYIVALLLLVTPFWLLYDLIFKKQTLYNSYLKFEKTVKTKWLAAILILLIAANWAWNIKKGL